MLMLGHVPLFQCEADDGNTCASTWEFALQLIAVLAFLLPLGVYCLLLASINRRGKPLMVSGAVDSIGLLFACSGFMIVTLPMLFAELYLRSFGPSNVAHLLVFWIRNWLMLLAYFLIVMSAATLMILWRTHKTMIYNVDAEQFTGVLERTLAQLGLGATQNKPRLIVAPLPRLSPPESTAITESTAPNPVAPPPPDDRYAELIVEAFPSMCHVTLHWDNYGEATRQQIEDELARALDPAAPMDNAAAGWFLSISGLLFGVIVMAVVTAAFLMVFAKQ